MQLKDTPMRSKILEGKVKRSLTFQHRKFIIDWVMNIAKLLKLSTQTFHHSIAILDKYAST
jgi:hypothetical protein